MSLNEIELCSFLCCFLVFFFLLCMLMPRAITHERAANKRRAHSPQSLSSELSSQSLSWSQTQRSGMQRRLSQRNSLSVHARGAEATLGKRGDLGQSEHWFEGLTWFILEKHRAGGQSDRCRWLDPARVCSHSCFTAALKDPNEERKKTLLPWAQQPRSGTVEELHYRQELACSQACLNSPGGKGWQASSLPLADLPRTACFSRCW